MTNTTWTINATATRPATGMRASGSYALPMCAFVGSVIGQPTLERHVDVATKRNPGTHVWSPPRR